MMDFNTFLNAVIDRGIKSASRDNPVLEQQSMVERAIAGMEACRGSTPDDLRTLLAITRRRRLTSEEDAAYYIGIHRTCSVASYYLLREGQPYIVEPSTADVTTAVKILTGD